MDTKKDATPPPEEKFKCVKKQRKAKRVKHEKPPEAAQLTETPSITPKQTPMIRPQRTPVASTLRTPPGLDTTPMRTPPGLDIKPVRVPSKANCLAKESHQSPQCAPSQSHTTPQMRPVTSKGPPSRSSTPNSVDRAASPSLQTRASSPLPPSCSATSKGKWASTRKTSASSDDDPKENVWTRRKKEMMVNRARREMHHTQSEQKDIVWSHKSKTDRTLIEGEGDPDDASYGVRALNSLSQSPGQRPYKAPRSGVGVIGAIIERQNSNSSLADSPDSHSSSPEVVDIVLTASPSSQSSLDLSMQSPMPVSGGVPHNLSLNDNFFSFMDDGDDPIGFTLESPDLLLSPSPEGNNAFNFDKKDDEESTASRPASIRLSSVFGQRTLFDPLIPNDGSPKASGSPGRPRSPKTSPAQKKPNSLDVDVSRVGKAEW